MNHPLVDVFAFQEALLLEAVLAIVILTLIWAGFRHWLRYKERVAQLIAEQTAERAAQYGAHVERVEDRLKVLEKMLSERDMQAVAPIGAPHENPAPTPLSDDGEP